MKNNRQKKGDLGQHWTPLETVELMTGLLSPWPKTVLEPTAGHGSFVRHLHNRTSVTAVEIDRSVVPADLRHLYTVSDLFEWSGGVYEAVIGNPPYVAGRLSPTQGTSLPPTANLYLHVMDRCLDHLSPGGQLIFIVPDTLLQVSRGRKLRNRMLQEGAFTHILRPEVQWSSAKVGTLVVRWVRGQGQGQVVTDRGTSNLWHSDGNIHLLTWTPAATLGDLFEIGVGAAPSALTPGDTPFLRGGQTIALKADDTGAWSRWRITEPRHKILVRSGPTRHKRPFYSTTAWTHEQASRHLDHYLLPPTDWTDDRIDRATEALNDWMAEHDEELGLRRGGRWGASVSQLRSLPIDRALQSSIVT